MTTRKDKVRDLLADAGRHGQITVGGNRYRTEDGWVDGHHLIHPSIGGMHGDRRMRELRADGVQIEKRRHPTNPDAAWQYRIVPPTPKLF